MQLCAGVASDSPRLAALSGHPHGMVNGQKSLDLGSHSPNGRQPSPLTSPLLNDASSVRTDDEDEVRRKVCKPPTPLSDIRKKAAESDYTNY